MAVPVGVTPPEAWLARRRLFSGLEQISDARFEPLSTSSRDGFSAIVQFGLNADALRRSTLAPKDRLVFVEPARSQPRPVAVTLGHGVDRRLAGQCLLEKATALGS